MTVFFASDHAGFELKGTLLAFVKELGHEVEDLGPYALDPSDDYPVYVAPCAEKVADTPNAMGIVLGWSGQGEAMVANRIKGVRAAVFYGGSTELVTLSREHNNANILSLGAHFLSEDEAKAAVSLFLSTAFTQDERHVRRIGQF